MKRILKWIVGIVLVIGGVAFLAFLYFIPPFLTATPETFSGPMATAPPVSRIADPAERAIAERGREIVMRTGCIGCHATNGSQGPDLTKYLAGGGLKFQTPHGTFVSRNLTPDKETGLGKRTDDEVKRVLRSGLFADGHIAPHTVRPSPDTRYRQAAGDHQAGRHRTGLRRQGLRRDAGQSRRIGSHHAQRTITRSNQGGVSR